MFDLRIKNRKFDMRKFKSKNKQLVVNKDLNK